MAIERLLTLGEVSELLQIPKATLYAMRYESRPPGSLGVRIGNAVRFRESDLERWLDEQAEARRAR